MLNLRKTLKCPGGRIDFQRFALHLEWRVMHTNMHSGISVTAGYCKWSASRRMTWYNHGDGTFVKSRALVSVSYTERGMWMSPPASPSHTTVELSEGPLSPCLTCAYPWLHWALLTYLLQSSHFIPFLISKLWFPLHTSSCFDVRFASQDFKIPDFKLLNRASEWLSLRKCWNITSYFNRHVIQNTPPAIAALFTLNDSERLYLLQTLLLKPGCISCKSLDVHSVIIWKPDLSTFPIAYKRSTKKGIKDFLYS